MAQKERDAPLRIARGGVGKAPLSRLLDASRLACASLFKTRTDKPLYGSPVTYYFRASYTYRVSDALGYARNNSECYIVSGFLPEPAAKIQIIFVNKVSVEKKLKK